MNTPVCRRSLGAISVVLMILFLGSQTREAAAQSEWVTHTVVKGETLYRISVNSSIPVDEIKRINGLVDNTIHVGQVLKLYRNPSAVASPVVDPVPDPPVTEDPPVQQPPPPDIEPTEAAPDVEPVVQPARMPTSPGSPDLVYHTFEQGETLYSVSVKYGTTVDSLLQVNGGYAFRFAPGDSLLVPVKRVGGNVSTYDVPSVYEQGYLRQYPANYKSRLMANGERYSANKFVVSHTSLPFGTLVLITCPGNNRSTFAEVSDRLPEGSDYLMDMSAAVASALKLDRADDPKVEVRIVQ